MRKMKLLFRLLAIMVCIICTLDVSAYSFYQDGLYYNITGSNTVEVTYDDNGYYQDTNVIIPKTVKNGGTTYTVTAIGEEAFYQCNRVHFVIIPNTVTTIGDYAFEDCTNLASVTIGASVTEIGRYAFRNCSNLADVKCWATCPPVLFDRYSFDTSIHPTFTVPRNCSESYDSDELWGLLGSFIESNFDFVDNDIYYRITGTNTVEVTYGRSVSEDHTYNDYCYGGDVNIPPTVMFEGMTYLVTAIGEHAFQDSYLENVTIPNMVTSIGDEAFKECLAMHSITIPNSVNAIGDYAFYNCLDLDSVTIGTSVTNIGEGAFSLCRELAVVTCLSTTPPTMASSNVFDTSTYNNADLKVPSGQYDTYQASNWWSNFSHIYELPYSFEKDGICYHILSGNGNAVEVTYKYFVDGLHPGSDYSGDVTIPHEVQYNGITYQVTAIGDRAFYNCTDLTSISIPDMVNRIGLEAFYRCTGLRSITIPNQVTSIDGNTFSSCTGLTSVTIPNSVSVIRQNAFYGCRLITSVICMAITPPTLEQGAFNSAVYSNATLSVPKGRLSAYQAANYWKNFSNIIELSGQYDFVVDAIIYKITDADAHTVKVSYMNTDFNSYSGNVVIPDSVTYEGVTYLVTAIDDAAFGNSTNLTSVTIPNTVTTIGSSAFGNCSNLQEVVIPNSVTSIGFLAFWGCTSLTKVTIGALMNSISYSVFNNCPLTSVTCLALTPPEMANSAVFSNDTYSNVTLVVPKGCKSAYQAADYWNNFSNIIEMTGQFDFVVDRVIYRKTGLNNVEVTSINSNLSSYSGDVYIPESVTYDGVTYSVTAIGEEAFAECRNMTYVEIPGSVTTIGRSAFSNCSNLQRLALSNVTAIGDLACWGCTSLGTVWMGPVTYIGCSAFDNCPAITTVLCLAYTPPTMGNSTVFSDAVYSNATLYVRRPFVSTYRSADWWKNFSTIRDWDYDLLVDGIYYCYTSDNTVEVTYDYYLPDYGPQTPYTGDVSIPETITSDGKTYQVTSIGEGAFIMCPDLTSVTIPETVTKIGQMAFLGCTSLTSVSIPNSVTEIGLWAFGGCSGLTSVTIGSCVVSMENAFNNCTGITSVTCLATTPPILWGTNDFADVVYSNATLYVPYASVSAYRAAVGWKDFAHIEGIIDNFILGDLNFDGVLDVSDVTAMISLVLGYGTPNLAVADLNFDGLVDVTDVTALISHVLNGTVPMMPFQSFTVNGVTFKMINVEGGTFMMGAADDDPEAYPQEFPRHQVTLSGFAIGETEVTQELWEAVMGTNPSVFPGHPKRPVDLASWDDCQEFVAALNALTGKQFRLPSEAEWEYAARGGKKSHGYMYAGSNNIDEVAWYMDNSYNVGSGSPDYGTHDVATKAPNELGLYDMSGNAWELVQDWYGSYSSIAQTDPTGPATGSMRVIRGGCWDAGYWEGRVTARRDRAPSYKTAGLRLAL